LTKSEKLAKILQKQEATLSVLYAVIFM